MTTEQRRHEALRLRAEGKKLREIAKVLGVSHQAVSQYFPHNAEKERQRNLALYRKKAGRPVRAYRCSKCREPGHIARHCTPDRSAA